MRSLRISHDRQVIGMRRPRPIAFEKASLAEKRVAMVGKLKRTWVC